MEPPDLVGLPKLGGNTTRYLPPATLPTDGLGILVFEELNRCQRYMRGPCLELLTRRRLNDYKLPEGWLPAAAINPDGEDYDVESLDPALLSRFTRVIVVPRVEEWVAWGRKAGIHADVLRYVSSDQTVFASPESNPRAWKYVSDHLHAFESHGSDQTTLRAAIIGEVGDQRGAAFLRTLKPKRQDRPLGADDILSSYSKSRSRVQGWIRSGRLDLVTAGLLAVKKQIQAKTDFEAVKHNRRKWANLVRFVRSPWGSFGRRQEILPRSQVSLSQKATGLGGAIVSDTYDSWEQARGKLGIVMERMLDKYPFHVAVLERFRLAARPDVGTMGVAPSGDHVQLLANPDFVLATPADELVGVLVHEVHHVVFGHLTADPQQYSDEWARTMAEEVTVNEFITEPLPEGCIRLADFPRLPPMESTEERYARLKRATSRKPISGPRQVDTLAQSPTVPPPPEGLGRLLRSKTREPLTTTACGRRRPRTGASWRRPSGRSSTRPSAKWVRTRCRRI